MIRSLIRRPLTWVVLGLIAAVVGTVGLFVFQPWKAIIDTTVNEDAPVAIPSGSALAQPGQPADPGQAAGPKVLARGTLISHEHETSGSVVIIQQPDGTRILRLENLDTSDGPDLRVWLTDQPVKTGNAGWFVFDDGRYVSLGKLKGNKGNQNYAVPASVNLDQFRSMSIWCDRFNVSFGAAELAKG